MIRAHWSGRRLVVAGVLVVFVLCVWRLGLNVVMLHEGSDPFGTIGRFFGAAFAPALADQSPNLPEGATPFLGRVWADLLRTVRYAFVAMSLAVPLQVVVTFRSLDGRQVRSPVFVLSESVDSIEWKRSS